MGKVDYHLKNIFNTDGTRNIDDQNNGIKVKFPLTAVAGDIGGPNTAGFVLFTNEVDITPRYMNEVWNEVFGGSQSWFSVGGVLNRVKLG